MKKYNSEDYFSVIDKNTGRKICDCAEWIDAIMMVNFDPSGRTITKNKNLMGQVIDIDTPNCLPTNEIVNKKKKSQRKKINEIVNKKYSLKNGEGLPFVI